MENMEKITLYDEDGKGHDYELIDLFELDGSVYGGFAPELNSDIEDEVEIVMLKVVETADGEAFMEIEDEEEEIAAFNELVSREEEEEDEE